MAVKRPVRPCLIKDVYDITHQILFKRNPTTYHYLRREAAAINALHSNFKDVVNFEPTADSTRDEGTSLPFYQCTFERSFKHIGRRKSSCD